MTPFLAGMHWPTIGLRAGVVVGALGRLVLDAIADRTKIGNLRRFAAIVAGRLAAFLAARAAGRLASAVDAMRISACIRQRNMLAVESPYECALAGRLGECRLFALH